MRNIKGLDIPRDNGLKLFLEKEDMERLYDFEEECVEGYFRELDIALQQSTEERIKATNDRVENMSQKVEDINQKENLQSATVQNIDFRLRKMEESTEQILSTLAVIHRFMSAHTTLQDSMQGSAINVHEPLRLRTASETEQTSNTLGIVNQNKKRFNRSLTEVRPDAYIFDDGLHFEVRTVAEEDEMIRSHETLNEQQQQSANVRKQSVLSEDSDLFVPEKLYVPPPSGNEMKPPYLTLQARNETTSTESKDTLTPIEPTIQPIAEDEDGSTENIMELNFEVARQKALRRRAMGRRNSECCSNYDLNRSQTSLNATLAMSRRQLSLTHSEPDSGNELTGGAPRSAVMPIKSNRSLLLQFHSEYTSITDELENVCQMITSPTLSINRESNEKSCSNAEFAAMLEKKHLHECEESDYLMLSKLFQNRDSINESDDAFADDTSSGEIPHKRMLRRETAVELPISSSKMATDGSGAATSSRYASGAMGNAAVNNINERISPMLNHQSSSTERTPNQSQNYLSIASDSNQARLRKSIESLQKNSSSETEYSLQPYRVIKQSSNETNTSLTGSYNIDQSFGGHELSLDNTNDSTVHYTTVIENPDAGTSSDSASLNKTTDFTAATATTTTTASSPAAGTTTITSTPAKRVKGRQMSAEGGLRSLKKQFSIDHGTSKSFAGQSNDYSKPDSFDSPLTSRTNLKLPNSKTLATVASSSTSTDESKDERNIPTITTNVVLDEITKLSSNINNRTKDDENNTKGSDPPFNETMC